MFYRHETSKMWPYTIRKTENVAELKMKFTGNQNVKNGIGVSGKSTRTPQTSKGNMNGMVKLNGPKQKIQFENSEKVSTYTMYINFKHLIQ